MGHALIVDDNMLVSRAVEERLIPLGFDSFDHVWSEDQALTAAERRVPDLVVVGDNVEDGCAVNAARRISAAHDVPVVMVTADRHRTKLRLGSDVKAEGPFPLDEISRAVGQAWQAH